MKSFPFCSIIILNYEGEKVIEKCLNSVWQLDYPKDKYEVIVVDNNSKDNSRKILSEITRTRTNTKLIFMDKNLGFSKGNNVGMRSAKGEYVALVNNDCIVGKNWLKETVKTALADNKTFAVNPKILLYPKHFIVKFQLSPTLSPVFAWLQKSFLYDDFESRSFYLPLWKRPDHYQIELSFDHFKDKYVEFVISLSSRGPKLKDNDSLRRAITFMDKHIKIVNISKKGDDIEYHLLIDVTTVSVVKKSLDKIQNAGIMVFQDGYGRDIGAVVSSNQQYYEYDLGQYENQREVYAACGAAMLMNKKVLDKIGNLNENFFMYYEDVEISERARFAGYKIVYTPKAEVRHYHALFSKEWSPFFIYHVEKGRLLHVFYNFPLRVFLSTYYDLAYDCVVNLLSILFRLKSFIYKIKDKEPGQTEPKFIRRIQVIRALIFFIIMVPYLVIGRLKYNQVRSKKVVEQNYLKILRGEWYFS